MFKLAVKIVMGGIMLFLTIEWRKEFDRLTRFELLFWILIVTLLFNGVAVK